MLLARNGDLWFSTKSNLLFQYKKDSLYNRTIEFGVEKATILSIEEGDDETFYFGTDDSRLITLQNRKIETIELDPEINGINTLLHHADTLYLGTGLGLFKWHETLKGYSELDNTTVESIIIDQDETIWAGTMNGVIRIKKGGEAQVLDEENGLPNNIIQDLVFDSSGNLWIGTYRKGIGLLSDGPITSFTRNDGLRTDITSSIIKIGDGSYLFGNENGKLDVLKNGSFTPWKPHISIPDQRLKHLFQDDRKRIWVSTYGGLIVIDGSSANYYDTQTGFQDNFTRQAYQLQNGDIWVGTKNAGIAVFESLEEWTWITVDDGLTSNYILSIEQIDNGDVLVGTISGLNIIRNSQVIQTITTEDGLPSNLIFTTHTSGEYTWISSNDGLICYSNGSIFAFSTSNGMPSNIIYDVLEDNNGFFWMPSDNSILRAKASDLIAIAEGTASTFKVEQFDRSHGMKNSNCIGAVHSYKDDQGLLWVPTSGGIAMINPQESIGQIKEPTLVIEEVYSNQTKFHLTDTSSVSVPPSKNRIAIKYTGITYAQANLLNTRYRLQPFEKSWIMGTKDRIAEYTNLPPGKYTFQLQAGIGDEFFTTTKSQVIIIEAAWWQTMWAKVLLVFTIAICAGLIYWARTTALTKMNRKLEVTVLERTQEIQEQKNALNETIQQLKSAQEQMIQSDKMASLGVLAAGVAHEINNPLNFIQGGVDGLKEKLKVDKPLEEKDYQYLIAAIQEGVNRAAIIVSGLNEFSHSTEDKRGVFSVHHIINNCLAMVQHRIKKGIDLQLNFHETDLEVLANSGKIHQAFLNIITNAIQSIADKGWIKITTSRTVRKIKIVFQDSGEGIKPENLKRITEPFFSTKDPGKGTGLGLSITYAIIHEHRGTLNFKSEWGVGTTVTVSFPAAKAS